MKLPRTSVIVATLSALTASAVIWAQTAFHWIAVQTTAVSGASLATIALVGFVVEHLRKETPSRWVGVLVMIPTEVSAIVTLGIVFAWWPESATKVTGFVVALLTPIGALLGVSIAQAKVTSPETLEIEKAKAATPDAVAAAMNPKLLPPT